MRGLSEQSAEPLSPPRLNKALLPVSGYFDLWVCLISSALCFQSEFLCFSCSATSRVVCPHHLSADPDPNFYFSADSDPGPASHQTCANLQQLVFRLSTASFKPPRLNRDYPRPSMAPFWAYSRTLEFWHWAASQNVDLSGSGSTTLPVRYGYRYGTVFRSLRLFGHFKVFDVYPIFSCVKHTGRSLMHRYGTVTLGFLYFMMFSFVTDNCTFLAQMDFFAWHYCSDPVLQFQIFISPYAWIISLGCADCVRAPASASQKKTQPLLRRPRSH